MQRKSWYALIGFLALVGVGLLIYQHYRPVCPDDFGNSKDRTAAIEQWTNKYFDTHPDASLSDFASARRDFYRDHGCTEALQRVEDYKFGNVDSDVQDAIESAVEEQLQ